MLFRDLTTTQEMDCKLLLLQRREEIHFAPLLCFVVSYLRYLAGRKMVDDAMGMDDGTS